MKLRVVSVAALAAVALVLAGKPLTVAKKPHGRLVKQGRDELVKTDVTLSDGRVVPIEGGTLPDGSGMGSSEQEPVDVGDEVAVEPGRLKVKRKAKQGAALGGVALAYTWTGHRWPNGAVRYYVNTTTPPPPVTITAAQMQAALVTAAWRWQAVAPKLSITCAGLTTNNAVSGNRHSDVFWRVGQSPTSPGRAAATYYYWDSSGALIDADLLSYTQPGGSGAWYPDTGCVKAPYHQFADDLWTHELGHVVGLGHSTVSGATMWPLIPAQCDTSWRSLSADDIAAVRAAYR